MHIMYQVKKAQSLKGGGSVDTSRFLVDHHHPDPVVNPSIVHFLPLTWQARKGLMPGNKYFWGCFKA